MDVGAANNTVTRNTFVRAGSAGIADWSAGFGEVPIGQGSKVTYNSINEAPIGISDYYSGDLFEFNTFTNVAELAYPSN